MALATITNLTDEPLTISSLYITIAANSSFPIDRNFDELKAMPEIAQLWDDGIISFEAVQSPSEDRFSDQYLEIEWDVTPIVTSDFFAKVRDMICADPSAGTFTVHLPKITDTFKGRPVAVKNVTLSSNRIVLLPNGTDTIDGMTSFDMDVPRMSITVLADGTGNWMII